MSGNIIQRSAKSRAKPHGQAAPNYAWLRDQPNFSDVTLILLQVDVVGTAVVLPQAVNTPEQPKKRKTTACTRGCLQLLQQTDTGSPPAAKTHTGGHISLEHSTSLQPQPHIPPPPLSLALHASVLSSTSGYFKMLLTSSMGSWCAECKVATQTLEARELEAAKHVLKFMYTHELPADGGLVLDVTLLVWMIKVAVLWDVPDCITACNKSLCKLSNDQYPFHAIFSLLSNCDGNTVIKEQLCKAEKRLLRAFGDARAVMRDASHLQRLTTLPHVAMLALLDSNELRTDCEATVLLLLRAWYKANKANCSKEQLSQLRAKVRYIQIPAPFLCTVLPYLPSFRLTLEESNQLQMYRDNRDLGWERMERLTTGGVCPDGWFNTRERAQPSSCPDTKLWLHVEQSDMLAHVAAVAGMKDGGALPDTFRSRRVYGFGYYWTLAFKSTACKALGLHLEVHSPAEGQHDAQARCLVRFLRLDHASRESEEDPEDELTDLEDSQHEEVNVCKKDVLITTTTPEVWNDVLSVARLVLGGDKVALERWQKSWRDGTFNFEAHVTLSGEQQAENQRARAFSAHMQWIGPHCSESENSSHSETDSG